MPKAEDSLCEKHREFVPLIAAIDRVEGGIDDGSPILLRAETGGLLETLEHELIPHAVGEGRTIFPVLRRVTGSTEVTSEMLHEHREIARLTDELERIQGELMEAGLGSAQQEQMHEVPHRAAERGGASLRSGGAGLLPGPEDGAVARGGRGALRRHGEGDA